MPRIQKVNPDVQMLENELIEFTNWLQEVCKQLPPLVKNKADQSSNSAIKALCNYLVKNIPTAINAFKDQPDQKNMSAFVRKGDMLTSVINNLSSHLSLVQDFLTNLQSLVASIDQAKQGKVTPKAPIKGYHPLTHHRPDVTHLGAQESSFKSRGMQGKSKVQGHLNIAPGSPRGRR
jgi:hypothetical protein